MTPSPPRVIDLGRMSYGQAFEVQRAHVDEVLAARSGPGPEIGRILLVEHDPVVTISRRPGARDHLLASSETLARLGVEVCDTDRGGDITYHGPGQLVVYPILDLNRLNLGLHAYMRLLEQVVIDACEQWGVPAHRDPGATGVWVRGESGSAKIAAMGVRVRHWVSMHGLSLNIQPDMRHFDLIVPCGLAGRQVTSLQAERLARGLSSIDMSDARRVVSSVLSNAIEAAAHAADVARRNSAMGSPH